MQDLSLREIQLGALEILKAVDKICRENDITYFLYYGTLIGAIRHDGFIPWDDDIDIAMPRESYDKFIEYIKNNYEAVKPLELMHYSTNDKYIYPIARISDSRYRTEYIGVDDYGLGLFIDVYPLDGWGNTERDGKMIARSLSINKFFITLSGSKRYVPSYHNSAIRSVAKFVAYKMAKKMNVNDLLKKSDEMAKKYRYEDNIYVGCTCWIDLPDLKLRYKRESMKPILHKFEGYEFYIPEGYDDILKTTYGDYMKLPHEEEQIPHHDYKVFRKST